MLQTFRSEALDSAGGVGGHRSKHQPQPLINYHSVLAVELHDDSATPIPADTDGRFVVTLGQTYDYTPRSDQRSPRRSTRYQ